MMIWERVKVFLALSVCLIFFSGCAGNLFESMDSVGSDPGTKLKVAKMALDQGNYTQAKNEAQAILDDPTATAQHNDAHIVHAQALLGEAGVNATSIVSSILETEGSDFTRVYNSLPEINLEQLKAGTKELNEEVTTTDPDVQLTTGVANGLSAVFTVMDTFNVSGDSELTSADFADGQQYAYVDPGTGDEKTGDLSTAWGDLGTSVTANIDNAITNLDTAMGSKTEDEQIFIDNMREIQTRIDDVNLATLAADLDALDN